MFPVSAMTSLKNTTDDQSSTKIVKNQFRCKNYCILIFITVILIICNNIIFIGDYHFPYDIVSILHKRNNSDLNQDVKNTTNKLETEIVNMEKFDDSKNSTIIQNSENDINMNNTKLNDSISNLNLQNNTEQIEYERTKRDFNNNLRDHLKCYNLAYRSEVIRNGNYWILKNYIRANHGELKCYESVTYSTHAHYVFLDRLIPLVQNWNAPISLAIYVPYMQLQPTIHSILYLRNCIPESPMIRQFVTFHLYFNVKSIFGTIPKNDEFEKIDCNLLPPFNISNIGLIYKIFDSIQYPVNVGRNIARAAAQTHFILDSDIDLYPSSGLAENFLNMISYNTDLLLHIRVNPSIFIVPVFQVKNAVYYPKTKTELKPLLYSNQALVYNDRICPNCEIPSFINWIETDETNVLQIPKKLIHNSIYSNWQPIYIGTHSEPQFDERLSWEGKTERVIQTYLLCVLKYTFILLNNDFLVHRPGTQDFIRSDKTIQLKADELINETIYQELEIFYGTQQECKLY